MFEIVYTLPKCRVGIFRLWVAGLTFHSVRPKWTVQTAARMTTALQVTMLPPLLTKIKTQLLLINAPMTKGEKTVKFELACMFCCFSPLSSSPGCFVPIFSICGCFFPPFWITIDWRARPTNFHCWPIKRVTSTTSISAVRADSRQSRQCVWVECWNHRFGIFACNRQYCCYKRITRVGFRGWWCSTGPGIGHRCCWRSSGYRIKYVIGMSDALGPEGFQGPHIVDIFLLSHLSICAWFLLH